MAVKLIAKRRYRSPGAGIFVKAGEVLEVATRDDAYRLRRDSPGTFVFATAKTAKKAIEAPPHNRMIDRETTERRMSERTAGEGPITGAFGARG